RRTRRTRPVPPSSPPSASEARAPDTCPFATRLQKSENRRLPIQSRGMAWLTFRRASDAAAVGDEHLVPFGVCRERDLWVPRRDALQDRQIDRHAERTIEPCTSMTLRDHRACSGLQGRRGVACCVLDRG